MKTTKKETTAKTPTGSCLLDGGCITSETKVVSRDGRHTGRATGSTHRCQMEGCTGVRVTTRWKDGKTTHPCSKGMRWEFAKSRWQLRIL